MCKGVLLDTNLLLLYLVGLSRAGDIASHRRLNMFEQRHFQFLLDLVIPYNQVVVTPHCLAEVWNFIGEQSNAFDLHRTPLINFARGFVAQAVEIYHPAAQLVEREEIRWLGLADVSQISAALEGGFAMTSTDGRLCHQAMALGIKTHHFWQLAEGS
jgi:predicted nucleic acid-binding protein